MSRDARIGIAGATGALGKEIISVLDQAPWRPDTVVPLARATTKEPFAAYGDAQIAVDDLKTEGLEGLDALIVALPREAAGPVVDAAANAGVAVVDCTGSQLDQLDVPLALPWYGADALDEARSRDVVAVPSGPSTLIATVLGPLAERGWGATIEAQVSLPASSWGRDAIDELSRQVVALFNASPPPRKVFPSGFAFDLLPIVGEAGATGWSAEEVRAMAEIARLTGARADVSLLGVPVFSGLSAALRLEVPDDVTVDAVAQTLTEAGIEVSEHADVRRLPRPRRVEGQGSVQVGRIRRGVAGGALHLWAAADNLRLTATAAVGLTARLLEQR